jgi:hypothetical protein
VGGCPHRPGLAGPQGSASRARTSSASLLLSRSSAGWLKPAHAITMHATLLLPGLAWFASHTAWDEARRFRVVALATAGYSLLAVAVVGETLAGTGPLRAPVWADAFVAAGLLGFAAALPIHVKDGAHSAGCPPPGEPWWSTGPSGPDAIDKASHLSRPDPSGADQVDAEHQPTDLAVSTSGSRSGRTWLPVGGRSCCRLSSVAAAAVSPCPAAVAGVRRAGRAGSRCSAGRVRCPRSWTAVLRWLRRPGPLTSADEQLQPARSCRRAATAAAGPPPSCPAGHRGRYLGGCGTGHRGRLGGPLLLPEPRSVSSSSVAGRLVSGWCPDGWWPPPTPPEPAGGHRYRNRSPARRPLDGCRHRR